jgi:hypothetical protein
VIDAGRREVGPRPRSLRGRGASSAPAAARSSTSPASGLLAARVHRPHRTCSSRAGDGAAVETALERLRGNESPLVGRRGDGQRRAWPCPSPPRASGRRRPRHRLLGQPPLQWREGKPLALKLADRCDSTTATSWSRSLPGPRFRLRGEQSTLRLRGGVGGARSEVRDHEPRAALVPAEGPRPLLRLFTAAVPRLGAGAVDGGGDRMGPGGPGRQLRHARPGSRSSRSGPTSRAWPAWSSARRR